MKHLLQITWIRKPLAFVYHRMQLWCAETLSDNAYLHLKAFTRLHHILHLKHPVLFWEKLNYLKLHDRKPIYHTMVDKYDMRSFVAQKVGDGYTIPVLGLWHSFEDIDFDKLPDQFILKGTFDSGSYYICQDKAHFDRKKARKQLYINWDHDYYIWSREWPYKGLQHRIIAEPLIDDPKKLKEFKFYCFEGEPKFYQTCLDRDREQGGAILKFYDTDGSPMDNIMDKHHCRPSNLDITTSQHLDKMLELCKVFAADTHFLRVDFLEANDKIYISEFTFYENGGWCEFMPSEWDKTLGDWIKIK